MDCIKVQEKKKKVVVLCSRPRQNAKLGNFTLSRATTAKKCTKSVMPVQSCCFANLNLLLFCRTRCRHRRRCLSSLITIAEGFTNSCPWWMFYFISPVQVLMVMHPINNASRQVLFHQRIFPLTDLHFNDLTNLSPLQLIRIWCQIVLLWQKTFAQISQRMILGEGKTTKEKKSIFF